MATPRRSPKVMVHVIPEMIVRAIKGDSGHCMIAEAVAAAYPGASHVSVDLQTVRFSDMTKRERYTYLTPRIAQVALCRFDAGHDDLEPFSFQLRSAQVTLAGRRPRRKPERAETEKSKAARDKGLRQAQLIQNAGGGAIPERIGGQAPPRGPLACGGRVAPGRRRQFGMRSLEYNEPGEVLRTRE
jgi:hypothetical protein